jgi:DNA-binding GntR family transcriptional regulator
MKDESITIATRIAGAIAEQIISGALPPNAPLRQDHVARQFKSSHVPVREAFRQLEAQHLVVSIPRRGVRIAPLDAASVREIAEMRAALEVVALRHAGARITPVHLAKIELALIECDNAETLANSRLVFATARHAGWQPRSNQDHRLILQALRARNLDQACSLLARHIQTIERLTTPAH